jgi:hypothetical protein
MFIAVLAEENTGNTAVIGQCNPFWAQLPHSQQHKQSCACFPKADLNGVSIELCFTLQRHVNNTQTHVVLVNPARKRLRLSREA